MCKDRLSVDEMLEDLKQIRSHTLNLEERDEWIATIYGIHRVMSENPNLTINEAMDLVKERWSAL